MMHAILLLILAATEWENSYAILFMLLVEVIPAAIMLWIFMPSLHTLTMNRVNTMVSTVTGSSSSSDSSSLGSSTSGSSGYSSSSSTSD
jgi:hypothetical protein